MGKSHSILVFATQYMPTGGIESHLKEFCGHISRAGVAIDLVVLNSKMLPHDESFFRNICSQVYLGNYGRSSIRLIWLLMVSIRLCLKSYKALYTNGQGESIILFSRLVFRRATWVHHHHTSGDAADQMTWGKLYHVTLRGADRIVACSQRNARDIVRALGRRIDVVPCFSRKVEHRRDIPQRGDRIRFGYYGRLIREKGIDMICRLSQDAELRDLEFHLWGQGECYPPSHFKRFPYIKYHGVFHSTHELTDVINSLDAFLLISTHPEGLPICLLEVMSAGLPWLATNRGGISDIALDAVSTRIISSASDYNEIKKEILSLAHDIKNGKAVRNRQMDLYNKKFSSTALIVEWRNLLGLSG